jgi:hypothetical protein
MDWKTYKDNLKYGLHSIYSPNFFCNYDLTSNYLYFKGFFRQHFYVLFLPNIFKNEISCSSFMDNVGLLAPTKQVSEVFTYNFRSI